MRGRNVFTPKTIRSACIPTVPSARIRTEREHRRVSSTAMHARGLTLSHYSYMLIFLIREVSMRHIRLRVRLFRLGEAQAEGVVAVLALVATALVGIALWIHL